MICRFKKGVICYYSRKEYGCQGCPIFELSGQVRLAPNKKKPIIEVKNIMPVDFNKEQSDFDLPLISTIEVGTKLEILSVRFDESQFGEYAVFETKEQGSLRSGNQVLLKNLHRIQELMVEHNDTVTVELKKTKRYYHF